MNIYKFILVVAVLLPILTPYSEFSAMTVIEQAALNEGVDPKILKGIAHTESKFKITALNKFDGGSPSYGMFQIKLGTAKMMGFKGNKKELMSLQVNAKYAAKYLKYQLDRYDGDVRKAVLAYNMGSYRAKRYKKVEVASNESYYNKVIQGSKFNTDSIFK